MDLCICPPMHSEEACASKSKEMKDITYVCRKRPRHPLEKEGGGGGR